jgi:hypothetical protein
MCSKPQGFKKTGFCQKNPLSRLFERFLKKIVLKKPVSGVCVSGHIARSAAAHRVLE